MLVLRGCKLLDRPQKANTCNASLFMVRVRVRVGDGVGVRVRVRQKS